MHRLFSVALLTLLVLAGCEGPRVKKLEERLASLENEVMELKQKLDSGAGAAEDPLAQRAKAMEALKNLAEKMEEQTFIADSSLKAGTGSVDVLVVPREDTTESRENFMLALRDPNGSGLTIHSGVEVFLGDKSYGKTPKQGALRVDGLAPGEYEFTLRADGYDDRVYPFEIREGNVKKIVTFLLAPGDMHDAREGLKNFFNQMQGQAEEQ